MHWPLRYKCLKHFFSSSPALYTNKLECLFQSKPFQPNVIFFSQTKCIRFHFKGILSTQVGFKGISDTSTLADLIALSVTGKKFMCYTCQCYNTFFFVTGTLYK